MITKIKNWFTNDPKAWMKFIGLAVLGAGLGFFYYKYFGCRGTCSITNNSGLTTSLGLLLGINFGIDFILKKKENIQGGENV
jgi:F0F1-type ATP synthase assembly protein I